MKSIYQIGILWILFLSSCSKSNTSAYDPNVKSGLSIEFDNIAGSSDLLLNTGNYTNASGEKFTVSKLRYYVSNFVLTATNGTEYTVPQDSCYFLIDESDPSTHEPLLQVPEGEYKTMRFILGVDSLRSTKAYDKGLPVLDPHYADGEMFWDLNRGYIFFNMEGSSPAAGSSGNYQYQIGGYGGFDSATFNNIKTISLDLTARGVPKVKTGTEPNLHLMVDILKMFDGPAKINIAAQPVVMFDPFSTTVAGHLTGLFIHDHTEN
jgi:hypothetical protein